MTFNILLFVLINLSFGGNEVGNGGDAVICLKEAPVLLDFFENKNSKKPYKINRVDEKEEFKYLKKVWGQGLSYVSPGLFSKYSNDLGQFKGKTKFISGDKFRNIRDSFHISLPKKCTLHQVAIQKLDSRTRDTVIYINKDIYEKMDVHQKAGLISHEIIYEHFRYFGQNNSVNVRELNRYLFSKEVLKKDKSAFTKLIQSMGVPVY